MMQSMHSSQRGGKVAPDRSIDEKSFEKYNEINEKILNSLLGKAGGGGGNGVVRDGGNNNSVGTSNGGGYTGNTGSISTPWGSSSTLKSCLSASTLKSCLSTSNISGANNLSRINSRNNFSETGSESGCGGGMKRNVSFNSITIRDYDPCVGDNPSVSTGVPISIDWEYEEQQAIDLERYEKSRDGQRRERSEMRIPSFVRRDVLKSNGFSSSEIQSATKDANAIRKKRYNTRKQKPVMEKTSNMLEKVSRNIRRVVSANSMGKELEDMLQRANSSKESLDAANRNYRMLRKTQSVDQFSSQNNHYNNNNNNNGESKQNATWGSQSPSKKKTASRCEIQQRINLLDQRIKKRVSLGSGSSIEKINKILNQRSLSVDHLSNQQCSSSNNSNGGSKQNATWNNHNGVSNKRMSDSTIIKNINYLDKKIETAAEIAATTTSPPPQNASNTLNNRVNKLRGFQSCASLSNNNNAKNVVPSMSSHRQKPLGGYGRRSYTVSRSSNSLSIMKTIAEQSSSSSRPQQQSNNNAGGNANATWNTNKSTGSMNNRRPMGSYGPGLESKLSRHKLNISVGNLSNGYGGSVGGGSGNASWDTTNKTTNANWGVSNQKILGLSSHMKLTTKGSLSSQMTLQKGASLLAQHKQGGGAGISAAAASSLLAQHKQGGGAGISAAAASSLLAQHNRERLSFKVAGQNASSSRISNLQNAIMANALQASNAAHHPN